MPHVVLTSKVTGELAAGLDRLVEEGWFLNRSDAVRQAIRDLVQRRHLERLEEAMLEDIEWALDTDV